MSHSVFKSLVALCLIGGNAFASSQGDSTKTYILDPIVVTATQINALRSSVPNAVSVLSKADLQASGETSVLRAINERVPGVFVTERGVLGYGVSNGAAGGITIRGTGGSPNTEVLVLTDGRPQLMGLMGHPLPDTYLNSGVERVEIIRGPASIMHGTNAMGGVINIIRAKAPADGLTGSLGTSYGTFNTFKGEGELDYGTDHEGVSFDANRYTTDGSRPYASFRENNGAVRGWTRLSGSFTLTADANISGFRTYDPGPSSTPAINHWVDIVRGSSGFSLAHHDGTSQGALKGYFNWGIHDIYDGFHSTDNNIGALVYQGVQLGPDNVTTVGLDYKRYGGKARTGVLDYGEHFVNEEGAYLLTRQDLFGRLNVTAGVRVNRHSVYGTEWVPQAGFALRTDPSTTVKVSIGKGFRSPTIRELYLFPAPTPGLKPERMWNYEVGFLRSFLDGAATMEVTGFIAKGTNQIRVLGMYPNLTLSNSGSFTHRGVEFAGSARPLQQLTIDLTYGYLDPGTETGANPRHKVYLGGRYVLSDVTMSLGTQYVAGLYGADIHKQPLSDYAVVNARISVRLGSGLAAYVAVENLFDRHYQILFDYPMPGATFFGGLTYSIL